MSPHNILRKLHSKSIVNSKKLKFYVNSKKCRDKKCREIPILDPNMAIFKQSQKSNQIEFWHAVNVILFPVTSLVEWYHIQVLQTTGKVLFEAAKTGNSRSVSIAHSLRGAFISGRVGTRYRGCWILSMNKTEHSKFEVKFDISQRTFMDNLKHQSMCTFKHIAQ